MADGFDQLSASPAHHETIVQRIADATDPGELGDRTGRRSGDLIQFGHRASWGAVLEIVTSGRPIGIRRNELVLGSGLWRLGLDVLLPTIGAHPGTWTWKRRGFALKLSDHTAYGLATAATLEI